jgi:hypothetical protein
VYNSLAEKLPKHSKILIRGLGIDKMTDLANATRTTLKGFKDDELKFFDEDDYYNASSKVKDVSKFLQYFQIEFIILIPKVIPKTGQLNLNLEKTYTVNPGWEDDDDRERVSNPLQNQKPK